MQLQTLKLVTIVAEQVLREQICDKIIELGATGYTLSEVEGYGPRGTRTGIGRGDNVRVEVICPLTVAETILTFVSHHYFKSYACIAWVTDVAVMRGDHYVKRM
jgi:nitrogen regulatory protein P-II 2